MNVKVWVGFGAVLIVQVLIAFACHKRWPDANVPMIAVYVIGGSAGGFLVAMLGRPRS